MATMRVLCSLLMVVVTWAREVFPIEKPFDEETLRDAEAILRKDCGESCVEVLRAIAFPEGARGNATWASILQDITNEGMRQAGMSGRLEVASAMAARVSHVGRVSDHASSGSAALPALFMNGVACGSKTACLIKSMLANKCNYGRVGLQMAYKGVNIVVHIMGVLTSLLCGCLYVHRAAVCVLQVVPPVCTFPYSVYSKLFKVSQQLWESGKSVTNVCMVHGSALVSS